MALLLGLTVALASALAGCGTGGEDRDAGRDATELVRDGLAAHNAGQLDEAAQLYREALAVDDGNAHALYHLGLIAQQAGDSDRAETLYRDAVEVEPTFTPALFNLAILRTEAGDYDEAADLYRRVTEAEPGNAAARLNLGFVLRDQLGKATKGQAELDRAVELDPALAARLTETDTPSATTTSSPTGTPTTTGTPPTTAP